MTMNLRRTLVPRGQAISPGLTTDRWRDRSAGAAEVRTRYTCRRVRFSAKVGRGDPPPAIPRKVTFLRMGGRPVTWRPVVIADPLPVARVAPAAVSGTAWPSAKPVCQPGQVLSATPCRNRPVALVNGGVNPPDSGGQRRIACSSSSPQTAIDRGDSDAGLGGGASPA